MIRLCSIMIFAALLSVSISPLYSQITEKPRAAESITFDVNFKKGRQDKPLSVELVQNSIIVPIVVKGVKTFALLDNRMEHSQIDITFARSLGLDIGRDIGYLATPTGRVKQNLVRNVPIELEGQLDSIAPFAAADLSVVRESVDRPVSVIIGTDYFSQIAFIFDFSAKEMRLGPSGSLHVSADGTFATLTDQRPQVEVKINGATIPVTIDLGYNGDLILAPSAWLKLNLGHTPKTSQTTVYLDGKVSTTNYVTLPSLEFGPFEASRVKVSEQAIAAANTEGLLGLGFLSRFDFALDSKAQKLWLIRKRIQ